MGIGNYCICRDQLSLGVKQSGSESTQARVKGFQVTQKGDLSVTVSFIMNYSLSITMSRPRMCTADAQEHHLIRK